MEFSLTVLGSNSAIPCFNRHPSAQVLQASNKLYLIDCGDGTQVRMDHLRIKRMKIDRIFISHLHGDHVFGLPGLLTSYNLLGRSSPLHIYGPTGLENMIMSYVSHTGISFRYDLTFHGIQTTSRTMIAEDERLKIFAFPLDHWDQTYGFLFQEKPGKRKLNMDAVLAYGVPEVQRKHIIQGEDFVADDGRIIANELLTYPADLPRSYAYCSDTAYKEEIVSSIQGASLLYHESTYLDDMAQQAKERKHSTAKQAGQIAKKAGVKRLLIGHFSSRYRDLEPFLSEVRSTFRESSLAIEGKSYPIGR